MDRVQCTRLYFNSENVDSSTLQGCPRCGGAVYEAEKQTIKDEVNSLKVRSSGQIRFTSPRFTTRSASPVLDAPDILTLSMPMLDQVRRLRERSNISIVV